MPAGKPRYKPFPLMCEDSALPTLHNSRELYLVFPVAWLGKKAMQKTQETWVWSLGRKIPRRKWQLAPVFLPRKFYGPRSLAGDSLCDRKESVTKLAYTCSHTHTHTYTHTHTHTHTHVNGSPILYRNCEGWVRFLNTGCNLKCRRVVIRRHVWPEASD